MNTPNFLAELEGKDTNELLALRHELVLRSQGANGRLQGTKLTDDELTTLVSIFSILRRRASPAAARKAPPKSMDVNSIPDNL